MTNAATVCVLLSALTSMSSGTDIVVRTAVLTIGGPVVAAITWFVALS